MRADLKERGRSVSLILMGRAFHREGAIYLKVRWPYRFVVQSLGPGTARNASLSNRREQDRVQRGRVAGFHGQNSDRKQLMENMVTHGQPVELAVPQGILV